jgi:hypothetical protein
MFKRIFICAFLSAVSLLAFKNTQLTAAPIEEPSKNEIARVNWNFNIGIGGYCGPYCGPYGGSGYYYPPYPYYYPYAPYPYWHW